MMPQCRLPVLIVLLAGILISGPAVAEQQDARLEALFKRLKITKDPAEGSMLTRKIWQIWFTAPNRKIHLMMINGQSLLHRGRIGESISQFSAVIRLAPRFAEGWNRRAVARFIGEDYDGSLKDILHVLSLEPRHFGALAGMGAVYVKRKQYLNAVAAYRRALSVNPHQPLVRLRLLRLKKQLGDRDI
jgi:tetratricopeptide (TPR) repeat protein